ncbi:putative F-box protein At1g47790 [Bidens hawaiensis]|uniref:putative F-box protein At1g47790 n=1 Tax=Bidens hawaiensis TaxID=980011 RepID=UPI004049D0CB
MSDNIPFEMQIEILKRVHPVKSLIQFRSVSKQWKSLIDSPEFIAAHTVNHTHPHRLMLSYTNGVQKYVSIADDDTFPHHRYHPSPLLQDITLAWSVLIDCSHGLVCLCYPHRLEEKVVVVWNHSIRKSVRIILPLGSSVVGFGVCPKTSDPKIVRLMAPVNTVDWKAEVFTLGTGSWRSVSMNIRLPHVSTRFSDNQVIIDGVIHWVAFDSNTRSDNVIVSFDITSEEFGMVGLLDILACSKDLSIFKRKGSLAVIKYHLDAPICEGTFDTLSYKILGFRKNGELMTEHICGSDGMFRTTLEGSEPGAEHGDVIEMDVAYNSIPWMASYTESLLLLNHSDSIVR